MRSRPGFVVLATACLTLSLLAAPTAAAHEGESVITIEQTVPSSTGVEMMVRVTWANDGHAAIDATVTAVAVRSDGSSLPPETMESVDADGRYRVALALPDSGPWRVRVTTISPTGTLEADLPAAPPGTTPTTAPTTAPPESTPPTTTASETTLPEGATGEGDSDDDGVPWLAIVIPIGIVATAAAMAVASGRRRDRVDSGDQP